MAILDTLKQNKTDQVASLDSLKSNLFTSPKAGNKIDISKFEGYQAPSTVSNNLIASNIGKNPIPADKLNEPVVSPMQIQSTVNNALASSQSGFNASASKVAQEPVVIAEKPKSTREQIQEGMIGLLGKDNSLAKDAIRKEAQVEEKARTANRVLNELRSIRANYEDKKDKLETTNKEGRSMGAINNEINQLTKETNKNLAFKSIEYDIANNDYVSAQQTVDNRIKDINDEDNRQIQLYKTLYDFVQNDMSESEKMASQQAFQEKQAELDFGRQKEIAQLNSTLRRGDIAYENSLAQSLMNSTGAILTDAGKPLNDAQNTALGFAERTLQSNSIFDSIGSKFTGVKSYVGQMLPNFLKTDDRQKFEQAERNFINAVLRRESGAVISPEEFANAREQYFPRVGDGAEVLAQKAQNRETTIKGLYQSAGVAGQMQGSLNVAKLSNDELLDSIVEENVAGQSNEDFFNSMVNSLQK